MVVWIHFLGRNPNAVFATHLSNKLVAFGPHEAVQCGQGGTGHLSPPNAIGLVGAHLLLGAPEVAAELDGHHARLEAAKVQGLDEPVIIPVYVNRQEIECTGHPMHLEFVVDVLRRHECLAQAHRGIVGCLEQVLPSARRAASIGRVPRGTIQEQTLPAAVQAKVGGVQDFRPAAAELHEVGVCGSDGLEDGVEVAVLVELAADRRRLDMTEVNHLALAHIRAWQAAELLRPGLTLVLAVSRLQRMSLHLGP
mmetsp:Transcript_56962/g.78997  ORF Transcript_56962/g.78997 Transcript_56962/m.78997 type:complete len:252 (+) Transcript_56962:300-1055(+)